jgi:hypothetical protein
MLIGGAIYGYIIGAPGTHYDETAGIVARGCHVARGNRCVRRTVLGARSGRCWQPGSAASVLAMLEGRQEVRADLQLCGNASYRWTIILDTGL